MKTKFFEQYALSDAEVKTILENGILVFDTNVLLNLYSYTKSTKEEVLNIMKKNKNRLWMPYQVGWEFFNNRENKIRNVQGGCDKLLKFIDDSKNEFDKLLNNNYKRHPYIDRKSISELFSHQLKTVSDEIEKLKAQDPKYDKNDTILKQLTQLYNKKVGDDYSIEEYKKIFNDGEKRYEQKTPPGFADLKEKKDQGPRHLYGDLIIWKQMIDKAKSTNKDIIFISEDQKEDWYEKDSNKPRRDLIKEFGTLTEGKRILIYSQELFLKNIDKYLGSDVGNDVITEVKDVAREAEERRKRFDEIIALANSYDTSLINSFPELAHQNVKRFKYFLDKTQRWPSLSTIPPEPVAHDSYKKTLFSETFPSESYRHIAEQMNLEDLYPDLFESSFKKKEQDGNQSNDN